MKKILFITFMIIGLFSQDTNSPQENVEQETTQVKEGETHYFQAETSRLLDIIINSLYTQKDIFLREAISNSSDALDKVRFMSLQNEQINQEEPEMSIKIKADLDNNKLIIQDTGIGMSKDDLVNNLGTIARSGTTQFLEAIKQSGNLNLIGQFGVGFYSYFLVANKVTVISKKTGHEQYCWESTAGSTYKIWKDESDQKLTRGTMIILDVKEEAKEFLEISKLKDLVKRYSEFINFPIYLWESKEVTKEVEDDEVPTEDNKDDEVATEDNKDDEVPTEDNKDDEVVQEDNKDEQDPVQVKMTDNEDDMDGPVLDEEQQKPKKTVKETVWDWKQLNDNKAIWLKPIDEIEDEEYKKFYKTLTNDYQEPMDWIHFKAEGEIEFTALIYIPKAQPFNFMQQTDPEEEKSSLKLYVRRVLISDDFNELLPRYLRFVKGVVDSDDLPLNVSRESLQQMRILKTIKKKLVKKIIEKLTKVSTQDIDDDYDEDEETMTDAELDELDKKIEKRKEEMKGMYENFWNEFGKSIKAGIVEDVPNRKGLAEISRFYSTFNNSQSLTKLEDYVSRKKENQTDIYYLGGDSRTKMLENPVVKGLSNKEYEVLLLDEAIDEYTIHTLDKYKDYKFTNIGKSGFKLPQDDTDEDTLKKIERYYQPLTSWLQTLLSDEIEKINLKEHSTLDPMVVLAGSQGYSANMEKIIKAQATLTKDDSSQQFQQAKRILEVNPYHPFVKELLERVKSGADTETEEQAKILFEVALLHGGFELKTPSKFTGKFYKIMSDSFGISRDINKVDLDLSEFDEPEQQEEVQEQNDDTNIEDIVNEGQDQQEVEEPVMDTENNQEEFVNEEM